VQAQCNVNVVVLTDIQGHGFELAGDLTALRELVERSSCAIHATSGGHLQ